MFTEFGKKCWEMIRNWNLDEYYDEYSGYCNIPLDIVNNDLGIQSRIKGLLAEHDFKNDNTNDYEKWVLSLFTDSDGVDYVSLFTTSIG